MGHRSDRQSGSGADQTDVETPALTFHLSHAPDQSWQPSSLRAPGFALGQCQAAMHAVLTFVIQSRNNAEMYEVHGAWRGLQCPLTLGENGRISSGASARIVCGHSRSDAQAELCVL